MSKSTKKQKGGKSTSTRAAANAISLNDLDEKTLQEKLQVMEKELVMYKTKIEETKKENAWYQKEIADAQRETSEYLAYLEECKKEKMKRIAALQEVNKSEMDAYIKSRKEAQEEHQRKIDELRAQATELEMKVEQRNQDILSLSDVVFEAELNTMKEEMDQMDRDHREEITKMERQWLEERIQLQRESEHRLKMTEEAAHEHAMAFLQRHMEEMKRENEQLKQKLQRCIKETESMERTKRALEKQHQDLLRERDFQTMVSKIRLDQCPGAASRSKLAADSTIEQS